jgi:hypothetical protein
MIEIWRNIARKKNTAWTPSAPSFPLTTPFGKVAAHKKSRVGKETQKMSRKLKGKMEKRKKRRLRKEESSIR